MNSLLHVLRGRPRLLAGLVFGVIVGLILPNSLRPVARAILAWDAGVLLFLVAAVHLFYNRQPEDMDEDAERQEEGEWTVFGLTVIGIIASFVAIVSEFAALKSAPEDARPLHVVLVAVTLALSWLMSQTTFAFRYAHEYYARSDEAQAGVDGGLMFPGTEQPDYFDFMYFALVLGMTFQVSDVQITSRKLRRLATMQGIIGFVFNTVILALTINLMAGLLS